MAISLSELTGASTSGNVLNEVNSYADFLDSVPRLVNKADPTGATDAVQTVATKQPIALPLIDGEGYYFSSGVVGNYASTPSESSFNGLTDFVMEARGVTLKDWGDSNTYCFFAKWSAGGLNFIFRKTAANIDFYARVGGVDTTAQVAHGLTGTATVDLKITRSGSDLKFEINTGSGYYQQGSTGTLLTGALDAGTSIFEIGARYGGLDEVVHGAIKGVRIWDNSTESGDPVLDVDFTSPRIPHGAAEFTCETGQVVTVNTSGNNPAKVIKKPVLRFDGVNGFLTGLFDQTITQGGYAFAAFSVLGDGGPAWARVLSFNPTGGDDYQNGGQTFIIKSGTTNDLSLPTGTDTGMFDDANGDILVEASRGTNYSNSRVNDASVISQVAANTMSFDEFNLGASGSGTANASIDLEYLAFFPSLTDAQADQVRSFINNRNKVFYRWDTDGYYFFDGAATTDGQVFTGSGSWNGRIVGSDNGDSDFYISQNTLDDRPTTDGYKITFADNTDHFDTPQITLAAGDTHAWMVCGTSLGTFAYKVTVSGETELNLLGHLGNASYRKTGDLYGIILLPQNATNRDIEEARKLLIDRGAADGFSNSDIASYFFSRDDMLEFKPVDASGVLYAAGAWRDSNITSFNVELPNILNTSGTWRDTDLTSFGVQLPSAVRVDYAWRGCSSLSSFTTTDLKNCSNFSSAWQDCSSLTQFPQDAKLGTEATNVNFQHAWDSSGLTSFPALDLSKGNNFNSAWKLCSSLQSFPEDAKLGTEASNVNFQSAWQGSGLTSLPALDLSKGVNFLSAFLSSDISSIDPNVLLGTAASSATVDFANIFNDCQNLTEVPVGLNLSKGNRFQQAFRYCSSLVDFAPNIFDSIGTPLNYCFTSTWQGTSALNATSVENILVSIATSAQSAPSTGPEITIDYDVSTGSLTAATLSAIETLNGRGWSVNINNEIIVPNILQLQPAAAYSLRSFDSDADPTVVNVRRSSDGALSDFTASQVSDGTLTSWVNIDIVHHQSDFTSGLDGYTIDSNGTIVREDSYEGQSDVLKYEKTGGGRYGFRRVSTALNLEDGYKITFDYYADQSLAGKYWGIENPFSGTTSAASNVPSVVAGQWTSVTLNVPAGRASGTINLKLRIQDTVNEIYGTTDNGAVRFKNVVVTQTEANGYVTTFYDQSSNGNDSTQSTASSQPKLVENGVLLTDSSGNPAIVGDGVDDKLSHPTLTQSLDNSDFLVTAAFVDDLDMGIDGAIPRLYLQNNRMSYNNIAIITYTAQTGRKVMSFQVDGATQEVFSNGVSLGTASEAQVDIAQSMFNLQNSGADYSSGPLMEVVVFDANQSVQRTGIEKNINDHFNIY